MLLKLDDGAGEVSDDISQIIGIKKHSISASIRTIRDKVVFLEIQSMIKKGKDTDAALSAIAKAFSLSPQAVEGIYHKFRK